MIVYFTIVDINVTFTAYNPGMFRYLPVLFTIVVFCGAADASSFYISASGVFSSSDVAGGLAWPGESFGLQFTVDANPTPVGGTVDALGFDVPIVDFSYTLNGSFVNATPNEIRFNTLANGGLFDVNFGSGLNAEDFTFTGEQAFSGNTTSPVFTANNYPVSSWTYSDPLNFDAVNPTALSVAVSPTPEPASSLLLLLGSGLALLGFPFAEAYRSNKRFPKRFQRQEENNE